MGRVINDTSVKACANNKAWLEDCFRKGTTAELPKGTLYLRDTVNTPSTISCGRIRASAPSGYWVPSDHPTLANWLDSRGAKHPIEPRICMLTPGKPIFRLRGVKFVSEGWPMLEGQGDAPAIEVEGRSGIATGHHHLCVNTYNWAQAVKVLAGYYNSSNEFVPDENHGDNSYLDGVHLNTDTIFRSENQQALNWRINSFWQGTAGGDAIAFDVERGGSLTGRVTVENGQNTILRLFDYSDNQCYFDLDVWFDSMVDPNPSFTLVQLAKPENFWAQWFINMKGWSGKQQLPLSSVLKYDVPVNMNRTGWDINIKYVGMP